MGSPELPTNNEGMTDEQREGLALLERIKQTETAFHEAYNILSDLENGENRMRICDTLNAVQNDETTPNDFEGCDLIDLSSQKLKERYGTSFFPLAIMVPVKKWAEYYTEDQRNRPVSLGAGYVEKIKNGEVEEFFIDSEDSSLTKDIVYGNIKPGAGIIKNSPHYNREQFNPVLGLCYMPGTTKAEMPYPFSVTGITLFSDEVLDRVEVASHEELHKVFKIYSPFSEQLEECYRHTVEIGSSEYQKITSHVILDEVNAYRTSVASGKMTWQSVADRLCSEKYPFVGRYQIDPQMIQGACASIQYLEELGLSEAAITHILLNSETFQDLYGWYYINEDVKKMLKEDLT